MIEPLLILPMTILGFFGSDGFNSKMDNLFVFKIIIICSTYIILDNSIFKELFEDNFEDICSQNKIRTQSPLTKPQKLNCL